ncbi:MAG: S8 family serine peptidase [Myxococcota bacterium]
MRLLIASVLALGALSASAFFARYDADTPPERNVLTGELDRPCVATPCDAPDWSPLLVQSPTGPVAVLVDLNDDVGASAQRHLDAEVERAIAPFDHEGLEVALSESAALYRILVPPSELADLREALEDEADIESVEIEASFQLDLDQHVALEYVGLGEEVERSDGGEPFVPDDPYYKHQWHLDQIQMPAAWRRSRGEGVVVAVIDTGVLYRDHGRARQVPDLAGTAFVPGWDFVDGDDTPDDGHGHGTHVAGTIAQTTNNGVGVAGVAPDARIMPIRVLDNRGGGRYGNVAAGIRWAVDNGAKVLNLSLGGPIPSAAISNAIRHAHRKGAVVVVAAGNTGRGRVQFPAAARHAFAVGAVRFDETLSFYSSFGRHLDIVAPGGDLRVDQNRDGLPDGVLQNTMIPRKPDQNDYLGYQGTSMAAPHVAGVAALLVSAGVTDPEAVERIIQETAKAKQDRTRYGAGLVQANDALLAATRDRGLSSAALALLLGLGAFAVRRRRYEWGLVGTALGFGAALASVLGLVASSAGFVWPLAVSALVPLLAIGLAGHLRGGRVLGAGMGIAIAGFSLFEGLSPSLLSPIGAALGPLLIVGAALSLWLATATLRRSQG